MILTRLIEVIGLACVGVGVFTVTFTLARNPPAERPVVGIRGLKRHRAMESGGLFASFEPLMRLVSGWVAEVPWQGLRARLEDKAKVAGDFLGLSASDILALCVLGAVGMGSLGVFAIVAGNIEPIWAVLATLLGAYLPILRIDDEVSERFKVVGRSLPTSIDLAALCMGAGLDFPGALRQIVEKSSSRDAVIVEEFGRILQELDLGHTRRKALEGFAERVPIEAVKDFVNTVIQAEAKGTPLAEVLTIQARMLRMRRSVRAEELAAKAGLLMMGPMMFMFICVLLILLGPFIIQWMASGF